MTKKIIKDIFVKRKQFQPLNEEIEAAQSSNKRTLLMFVALVVVIGLAVGFGVAILSKISSAVVKITPRQELADVDSRIKASRPQNGESAKADNGLTFEITRLEKEEARAVIATGVAADGKKASGQIIVYNKYSSAPQPLIVNTRFEAPDGKVYRIKERIIVPGMGSKEITAYADQPGEGYNIGLVDFTIPGLKDGPRYNKVYARSKTEMKGGASGSARIVKTEDIEKVKKELLEKIKNDLINSLTRQKTEGRILYKNAMKVEYLYNPNNPKAGDAIGSSMFKVKGIATGFLMEEDDLSKLLADDNADKLKKLSNSGDVYIANLEALEFVLLSADSENKNINFQIKGNANFVWIVDSKKLVDDLTGHKGRDYDKFFQNYPDIKKAEIVINPSWWPIVTKNKSKIKIEEVLR